LVRHHADTSQARVVLEHLSQGIREVIETIEDATASGDEDYAQFIADDEVNFIEELLGAASVVCQRQAVSVASAAERALAHAGAPVPNGGGAWTRHRLFALGATHSERAGRSDVALLCDVANYYKHQDEWRGAWEQLKGVAGRTVMGISMLGMSRGSTGNLRTAAEALGNTEYTDLGILLSIVEDWSRVVIEYCDDHVR
jgi:hypothetical protein